MRFVIITLLSFALYMPFASIQYDTNGIMEAQAVEAGQLFHRNHMLYRPAGFAAYRLAQFPGYSGNALPVLQFLDAVFGALAIGLCYRAFERFSGNRVAAAGASAWLATSFSYWYCSTDAAYLPLAALFTAAALNMVTEPHTLKRAIAGGLLCAGAILTWQACIFVVPVLALLMLWDKPRSTEAHRSATAFLVACGFTVLATYITAASIVSGVSSVSGIAHWVVSYDSGPSLPIWGQWSFDRVTHAATSGLRSILPVLLMAGPSELTRADIQFGRFAVDAAVIALLLLLAAPLALRRLTGLDRMRVSRLFLLGYVIFLPFIIWWDPFEPKWFVIPNLMLAGFLATAWSPAMSVPVYRFVFVACITLSASTNFITTILPRHREPGPDRETAECVAQHTRRNDLILAAEWGWPEYLDYLYSRHTLNLINESARLGDREKTLESAAALTLETSRHDGNTYTQDPASYPASHVAWLESTTGLTPGDLASLHGDAAFSCGSRNFKVLFSKK